MAAWNGFTDEEIRRMRADLNPQDYDYDADSSPTHCPKSSNKLAKYPRQSDRLERKKASKNKSEWQSATPSEQMNDAMKLSSPNEKCRLLSTGATRTESPNDTESGNLNNSNHASVKTEDLENEVNCEERSSEDAPFHEVDLKLLDDKEVMNLEMRSIEAYQRKQREIEDHNKMKKQMLLKAIEERRRQTSKESSRLQEIQHELSKMDSLLSGDVSVLRDKIETASRDYMDAQKRYEKAEQEFVAAKMDLHHKSEIKQGLTEHLHIIIHQNEVRRSRKLADLMTKLDMESSPDTDDVTLNPTQNLMTSVQTLGPSGPANPNKILLDSIGVEKCLEIPETTNNDSDVTSARDDVTDVKEAPTSLGEMSDTESTDSPSHRKVQSQPQQSFVRELSV